MGFAATHPHDVVWPDLEAFGLAAPIVFQQCVDLCGDRVAVVDGSVSLTWAELHSVAHDLAVRMASHGLRRGDVVSVQLPNWWETVALFLAAWRVGAVLNPITPIYRGSELRTIFAMARPALVLYPGAFGDTDYQAMTLDALREAGISAATCAVRPPQADGSIIGTGPVASGELVDLGELDVDDVSILMFTSGTTGRPKGVLHSQRTLLYEAWSIADRLGLGSPSVFMPSPLTHITGLLYGILLPLLTRGSVALLDRWDPGRGVDIIERASCTFCVGATPFLAGLVEEYGRRGTTSCLEAFVCGGADVPPPVIRDADSVMGTLAVRAYGLTELPTLCCGSPEESVALRSTDDGLLIGPAQARIVPVDDGLGELEARGPELFLGYLDTADNAAAFTDDGWFRTGDLAELDGDRIRIVGRRKDIIVRGGENLSPAEVESILREMPHVVDIAVVGVPDDAFGERACAVLVVDGPAPTLAEIRDFLADRELARQKAPEHLLIAESLPRTASGKVQKFLLRQWAAEKLSLGEGESR